MRKDDEREIERWAAGLYKDLEGKENWAEVSGMPLGLVYRQFARAAFARHNMVCDQRCGRCNEVLTHWCAHCDRS